MGNKFFVMAAFFCCFLLASCGSNSNIFSWAHDSGSGNFEDLKSDGDAAMKDSRYGDAAKYYEKALKKNPNDADCAKGYATAKFFIVLGSQYGTIINTFVSGSATSAHLLGFLTADTSAKVVDALQSSMGTAGSENGYLANVANKSGASTDVLVNAAVTNIILGVAEVLSSDAGLENYLTLNSDFTVSVTRPPTEQERQRLYALVSNLLLRSETSARYLANAPIAQVPLDSKQSQLMTTVSDYVNTLKSELSTAKQFLQ